MTYEQILSNVSQKKFAPVYVLQGDEDFFIDEIHDALIAHVLQDHERDFNQSIFYGKDCNSAQIVEAARRFPMGAERNLVVLREGQYLRNIEELESYVKNATPSTVLLILYRGKKLDGRKSFAKTVAKHGVLFESKRLYDNQVSPWLQGFAQRKKVSLSPNALQLLVENLGNNLVQLANAIDKLSIVLPSGEEVTSKQIEEYIGISREYNVFEYLNAIGDKNFKKVFTIAQHFGDNPKENHPIMVIGQVADFFYKLMMIHFSSNKNRNHLCSILGIRPFFFDQYMRAAKNYPAKKCVKIYSKLREYDMKTKGKDNASTKEGGLLRELSFYILNY
ncbi:MAG: DNA polymerase III subunit delta [Luteibaculum sp.]